MLLKVVKEFTDAPGPRYKSEGKFSGELFRETILLPKIKEAIEKKETLLIDLDGAYGYGCGFLDEAFGGLIRTNKRTLAEFKKILRFKSDEEPGLIEEIRRYINQANNSENPITFYEFIDYWASRGKLIRIFKSKDDKDLSIRIQADEKGQEWGGFGDTFDIDTIQSFHEKLLRRMPE
jgi:hypothetical protein